MGGASRSVGERRERQRLRPSIYVGVLIVLALGIAWLVDQHTSLAFVETFIILSGIGSLPAIVREFHQGTPPRDVRTVLERVEDDESDDKQVAEETLDIAQIVTSEPGLTTLQTLMDDPRQWTTSELVDTAGHQIEDHAIEEAQEYAALHATLFSDVLPEMEREGIVTFERERGIVELTRPGYDYGQLLGLDGGTTTHDGVGRITGLELDELLDVYSSDRRQAVLAVLTELGGSGTLSEIVTEVAERETTEDMSEEQKQKRVWTSLRQLHMPRLDDSGLVDYIDVDEPTVTDNGRAVREIMEQIEAQYAGQLDVDLSLAYDLLQNRRRRWVIELLATADGGPKQLDLLGLSKEVAAGENEKPIPELTDAERKRVYVSLYQTHLPRLDQAGIVDFDHEQGTVTLRSDGRTLHQMQSDLVERCSGASLLE